MKMAQRSPNPECGRRSGVLARALWALSSVRLGLALFVGVAVYAALGTIPLGPFFEFLGGQAEAPAPTLRYLPWVDLRESEYYSTALFGALLIAIVANMTLATLLRIRWEMKKIGVLVTHAGVIVLAVGALMATHSPLNATMALFADEPTSIGLDRSRTLLRAGADQIGGSEGAQWRVDGVLPRYADFGVPWTDAEGVIELDERWRVTGYAHSARLVPRIEQGTAGMPPGWQVTERLRSGESRVIALVASNAENASATLSNGTTVLAVDGAWAASLSVVFEKILENSDGVVLIQVDGEEGALLLPASSGATATLDTPSGVWTAEFLDRTGFSVEQGFANFRLDGPNFEPATVFAAPWDPARIGMYAQSEDRSIAMVDLPTNIRVLYCDRREDALLLTPKGWLASKDSGEVRLGTSELQAGSELRIDATTTLTVDRVVDQARIVEALVRVPFVEDAQLLADPRLDSLVRVSDSLQSGSGLGTWVVFDEQAASHPGSKFYAYSAAPFVIENATLIFRGFAADLFRRGSVPRDLLVQLEIVKDGSVRTETLSLNQPVRATVDIEGRSRRVQFSLIGWDSEGWEARQQDAEDRFAGTRFVIVTVTQREGVGLSIAGGGLILLGAGISVLARMSRRTARVGDSL